MDKDGWINIHDKRPDRNTRHASKKGVTVLHYNAYLKKSKTMYYNFEGYCFKRPIRNGAGWRWERYDKVVYWQPLPENPKETHSEPTNRR